VRGAEVNPTPTEGDDHSYDWAKKSAETREDTEVMQWAEVIERVMSAVPPGKRHAVLGRVDYLFEAARRGRKVDSSRPLPASSKHWQRLRKALMSVLAEGSIRYTSNLDATPVNAVDKEILRQRFFEQNAELDKRARNRAFHHAFTQAAEQNLIGCDEVGEVNLVWLKCSDEAYSSESAA
jgi:hypothetical protein